MNHIITTNPIGELRSLKAPVDNFIVCHMYESDSKIYLTKHTQLYYELYVQDENMEEIEELLDSYEKEQITVIEVPYLSEIPNLVSSSILQGYVPEGQRDEDYDIEVPNVYISAEYDFSRLFTTSLNKSLRENMLDLEATNLLSYYQMTNLTKMVEMMKRELESEFIYPEDPVAFAYVTNRLLRGDLRGMLM